MSMALTCQARVHTRMAHICSSIQHNFCGRDTRVYVQLSVKLGEATHQNQRRIDIVYITIVFVSVLVSFVIAVILANVTWALSIRTAKTVTWALTQEWTLGRDTVVYTCIYLVAIKNYSIAETFSRETRAISIPSNFIDISQQAFSQMQINISPVLQPMPFTFVLITDIKFCVFRLRMHQN